MESVAIKQLQEQLTCSICLDIYKRPKMLPCHHSFCAECLKEIPFTSKGESTGGLLHCPVCRHPAESPQGDASHFPAAFMAVSMLELYNVMRSQKENASLCPEHRRPLEARCHTCEKFVCLECTSRTHAPHDFDIADEGNGEREYQRKMTEAMETVKNLQTVVGDALQGLAARETEITKQGEMVVNCIRNYAQLAIDGIERSKRELIMEVETDVQQKVRAVSLQKEQAKTTLEQLGTCLSFVQENLKADFPLQLLALKKQTVEHLKAVTSSVDPLAFQSKEEADILFHENNKVLEECKNLGRVSLKSHLTSPISVIGENRKIAQVGGEGVYEVKIVQQNGCPVAMVRSLLDFQLIATRGPHPTNVSITELGQARYRLTYIANSGSSHHLHVLTHGRPIHGSPLSLQVLPGKPLHTIPYLGQPWGVTISSTGQIAISCWGSSFISQPFARAPIKVYDINGSRVGMFGSYGKEEGQFREPCGIAFTKSGYILVADSFNHQLQLFTPDGHFVTAHGKIGLGNQFVQPAALAVHPNGQIFVAELGKNRIQVLHEDLN